MSRFAEEMAFYSSYHQEKRNILIHVFGVPTISFSVLVPMSWLVLFRLPESLGAFPITLAMVFAVGVLLYYFTLDVVFAAASTVLFGGLLAAAHWASGLGTTYGLIIFFSGQLLGWGTQFYGHYIFEGRRPALFDNLKQAILSAPIFVVADVFFELGFRKDLEKEVKDILAERGQLIDQRPAGETAS